MPRGRFLSKAVAQDGGVAEYGEEHGPEGLVFHHRLIAFLDKNGNVRADPYWLKGNVMPRVSGCSPEDCRRMAAGLVEHGLAVAYEVDGMPYLHFPRFRDHQIGLRHARESAEVPVPQGFDEDSGTMPEDFRQPSGYGPEDVRPQVEGEVEVEGTSSSPSLRSGSSDEREGAALDVENGDNGEPDELGWGELAGWMRTEGCPTYLWHQDEPPPGPSGPEDEWSSRRDISICRHLVDEGEPPWLVREVVKRTSELTDLEPPLRMTLYWQEGRRDRWEQAKAAVLRELDQGEAGNGRGSSRLGDFIRSPPG